MFYLTIIAIATVVCMSRSLQILFMFDLSTGFCHWPKPAWSKPDGTWQPATANFTSLADPSAMGSGLTALETLMHEAGHAAHFAVTYRLLDSTGMVVVHSVSLDSLFVCAFEISFSCCIRILNNPVHCSVRNVHRLVSPMPKTKACFWIRS